ncbi:MAG: chemotaxis protein CheB [Nitrospirales bacterium]
MPKKTQAAKPMKKRVKKVASPSILELNNNGEPRLSDSNGTTEKLHRHPSHIMGVGASAGGLDAIEQLFKNMPLRTGIGFVVIQHLSPAFPSMMVEILARHTLIPINRAEDGMPVEPDTIYLIPPKKNMILSSGILRLTDQDPTESLHLPIDIFFRSLAQDVRTRSMGVILSGTGADGSRGIREIHNVGGYVVVQDETTAKFDGMPRTAIATGVANSVSPPALIPNDVMNYIGAPQDEVDLDLSRTVTIGADTPVNDIFTLLRLRYGIEFHYYKAATIDRRLERRMKIVHCLTLQDYVGYLQDNPSELDRLYHDLLIGVTQFNRDPDAFIELQSHFYKLIETLPSDREELRVWIAGCATGQEAYTIAIMLREFADTTNQQCSIKIFATDVHQQSLDIATSGDYSEADLQELPKDVREKYFTKKGSEFHIIRDIRKMVVFANHNVISAAPFTKIDLICCRNMLIYFEPMIQRKVIALFHFALRAKGVLFLGPSENVGGVEDEFDTLSTKWKIFLKRRDVRLAEAKPLPTAMSNASNMQFPRKSQIALPKEGPDTMAIWAYEALLTDLVQTGILVNEQKEVLHVFGEATQFLRPTSGRPGTHLTKLVTDDLAKAITTGIHRVTRTKSTVEYRGVKLNTQSGQQQLMVKVKPLFNKRTNTTFYFSYIEQSLPTQISQDDIIDQRLHSNSTTDSLKDLHSELEYTKETLQTTNEELETSNEELQAANEELVAANEELQSTNEELLSTNEELQSTNEELQSVNEELHTVNAEYQRKIAELTQLTTDMDNLLISSEIATIFLDKSLSIRKFTPAVASMMHLLPRDLGRPISHINHQIDIGKEKLTEFCQQVYDSQELQEREIRCGQDQWMLMRILPYFDELQQVQGVVLTFVDITPLKRTELELKSYTAKLEASNQDLQDFAFVASHDLNEPLRKIITYNDQLGKALAGTLTEQAQDFMSRSTNAAQRMHVMIQDLLEFSRVHTRGQSFETQNCNTALDQAIDNLYVTIENSHSIIKRDLLPTLEIDQHQITQVFQNLISNAIKFCVEHTPMIHISATHQDSKWLFSVKDNGIGMTKNNRDKIFLIFYRLHGRSKFPGSGLGLAICKRIVERHEGEIWVESEEGLGSTFYFTLPTSHS